MLFVRYSAYNKFEKSLYGRKKNITPNADEVINLNCIASIFIKFRKYNPINSTIKIIKYQSINDSSYFI